MKWVVVSLMVLLAAFSIGAQQKQELVVLHGGDMLFSKIPGGYDKADGYTTWFEKAAAVFEKANPGFVMKPVAADLAAGTTITMDTMIAAGRAPAVYLDFGGRVGKYMIPEFALALDPYVKNIADFNPSIIASLKRGGKLMALPWNSWATGFCINTDLLASVGYTLPDQTKWTTDEFIVMAKKLKQAGKYATTLFAKNQSSDQWWMPWFYVFGGAQFVGGDYTRTRLNSPQSEAALNYLKMMVDEGYATPSPAESDDDTAAEWWGKGLAATLAMQATHAPGFIQSAIDAKYISKPFAYKFIEFPHAKGIDHVPTAAGPTIGVVYKSGNAAKDKASANLLQLLVGEEPQTLAAKISNGFPSLLKVPTADDPYLKQISALVKTGVMDLGILSPKFSEVRGQLFPLMQEFYSGRITAKEVLTRYEVAVNAILASK